MLLPVGVLALGATFVGFLAIPGVWEPFEKWLEPVVPPLVQATAAQDWFTSLISVALGVARDLPRLARVPGAARARPRRLRAHRARAQALVRRALRRRRLAPGAGWSRCACATASRRRSSRAASTRSPRVRFAARRATASVQSGLLRTYALAFTVAVADPDARLPGGPLMLTTALIVVPLAGAILVWVLPLSRESTSGLALLVALAEVGLWLGSARNFDFGSDAPQYSTTREWFDQLGISYSVGLYGFQFWLVGLTIVVGACAIGYGAWAERERSRAYFGLLLFLVGSLVGVFAAQDLIVFYVFFEAMLIPIYVLVGVWGGAAAGQGDGHVRDLHDGRLAADAGVDRRARRLEGDVPARRPRHELERLDLPRLPRGVRRQGAAAAVPRLAAPRVHAGAARGGRRSSPASSRRPPSSGSSGSSCRTSPSRSRTSARSSSCSRPRRSSTARCSPSASRTSAASSRTRRWARWA